MRLPKYTNFDHNYSLEDFHKEVVRLEKTAEMHYALYEETIKNLEQLYEKYKGCVNYKPVAYKEEFKLPPQPALSDLQLKVLSIIESKGVATANDVFKSTRHFKSSGLTTADIGEVIKSLALMNLCTIVRTNKGIKAKRNDTATVV